VVVCRGESEKLTSAKKLSQVAGLCQDNFIVTGVTKYFYQQVYIFIVGLWFITRAFGWN
jgi:hypothetical protein